jgi:hypothetical protein
MSISSAAYISTGRHNELVLKLTKNIGWNWEILGFD